MFSVLKVPKDKLESQSIGDPAERVTSVREQRKVPWEYMAAAMANAFIMNREWYSGDITTDELTRAEVIAKLRYANRDWTFER